jgi:predicted DNA-binding protein
MPKKAKTEVIHLRVDQKTYKRLSHFTDNKSAFVREALEAHMEIQEIYSGITETGWKNVREETKRLLKIYKGSKNGEIKLFEKITIDALKILAAIAESKKRPTGGR